MSETPDNQPSERPEIPQNRPVKLSPESAASLLRADLINLQRKVKAGKPLSASERNLLQSALAGDKPSTAEFVDTIVELAEQISVSRKTIQRWRKVEGSPQPRPDGRWHVPSWREWKLSRQGDGDDAEEGEDGDINQVQARVRQILLQNERLAMRILAEKKELIPKVVAQQVFSKLVMSAKTRCFTSITRFVTLARMAENSTAAAEEIRKEMILIWKSLEDGAWLK